MGRIELWLQPKPSLWPVQSAWLPKFTPAPEAQLVQQTSHPLGETGDRVLVGRERASPCDQPLHSCGSRMSLGQGGQLSVQSRLGNTCYCYHNNLIC